MKWWKRKPRNRRLTRKHVLDVKLNTRQRRQKWMRRGLGVGGTLGLLVLAFWLGQRSFQHLYQKLVVANPVFRIQHLEIQTDGVLSLAQLRYWAGVREGDHLFQIDPVRIKRDLEMVSVIRAVSVERRLPDRLIIRVQERRPVARFVLPQLQGLGPSSAFHYELDPEGYVMLPLSPEQLAVPKTRSQPLPEVVGIPIHAVKLGRRVESQQVQAALRLIEALQGSPLAGHVDVTRIDVATPNLLRVFTRQGSEVVLGLSDFPRQLRRWRLVHDYGRSLGRQIAFMDLSVSNNVPVRWAEFRPASASPASQPTRTSQYRSTRHHV